LREIRRFTMLRSNTSDYIKLFLRGSNLSWRPVYEWISLTPAGTTGWEEEPVHEDAAARPVVGVVGQQAVPLVLLLAPALAVATRGLGTSAELCVNGLLELFVVDNGSNLALAVGRPIGCGHLDTRIANVDHV